VCASTENSPENPSNLIRIIPAEGSQLCGTIVFHRGRFPELLRNGLMASNPNSFEVQLNGASHMITGDVRLIALFDQLRLRRGRVAVEINQVVIPKAEWDAVVLRPGDTVEIVNFVGGG
jgi:sulfur carrier protein